MRLLRGFITDDHAGRGLVDFHWSVGARVGAAVGPQPANWYRRVRVAGTLTVAAARHYLEHIQ